MLGFEVSGFGLPLSSTGTIASTNQTNENLLQTPSKMSDLISNLKTSTNTSTLYRMSQEECARLRESVPHVKVYRYNPKHLYPKLNGYGDNGQRSLKI